MEGTVKWFNRSKGYGFIEGEDGAEYFVHTSQLQGISFIRENDKVSFEPAETERGKQAQNVSLLQKGSEREDVAPSEDGEAPAEEAAPEAEETAAPAEDSENFGEE